MVKEVVVVPDNRHHCVTILVEEDRKDLVQAFYMDFLPVCQAKELSYVAYLPVVAVGKVVVDIPVVAPLANDSFYY